MKKDINYHALQSYAPDNLKNFSRESTEEGFNVPFYKLKDLMNSKPNVDSIEDASAQPGFLQRQLSYDPIMGAGSVVPTSGMGWDAGVQAGTPRLDKKKFGSNLSDLPSRFGRRWVAGQIPDPTYQTQGIPSTVDQVKKDLK